MTDHPYTDEDLRAEAARQHATLTDDPDYMGVGERMDHTFIESTIVDPDPQTGTEKITGRNWDDALDGPQFGEAQRRIHDLINGAADVSAWAIALGAANLTPHEPFACQFIDGTYEVAVQVATSDELTDDTRDALLPEIRKAVEQTVCRVLGLTPATK